MFAPVFTTSVTKEQAKDSGMAVVLSLLVIGFIAREGIFFRFAAGALLLNMIFPMLYYPFAIFWFGLANIMGFIISKILLKCDTGFTCSFSYIHALLKARQLKEQGVLDKLQPEYVVLGCWNGLPWPRK